jgi:hypothetical protein
MTLTPTFFSIFSLSNFKNNQTSSYVLLFNKSSFFLNQVASCPNSISFWKLLPSVPLQLDGRFGIDLWTQPQPCWNGLVTTWRWYNLLSTSLVQVIPTTCYSSANQQIASHFQLVGLQTCSIATTLLTTSLLQVHTITNFVTTFQQACMLHTCFANNLSTRCEIFTCVVEYIQLFNNYWMSLSRIWGIVKAEICVIFISRKLMRDHNLNSSYSTRT